MTVPCTHHCRACGRHFHSLEAFDAHHQREFEDGPRLACFVPDTDDEVANRYVGFQGECHISDPTKPDLDCTVWELERRRATVKTRKVAA